jgi:hypothetical protein
VCVCVYTLLYRYIHITYYIYTYYIYIYNVWVGVVCMYACMHVCMYVCMYIYLVYGRRIRRSDKLFLKKKERKVSDPPDDDYLVLRLYEGLAVAVAVAVTEKPLYTPFGESSAITPPFH